MLLFIPKMIKSDNFTINNRENFNIAIAILEKLIIGYIIISNFWGINNILNTHYIYLSILKHTAGENIIGAVKMTKKNNIYHEKLVFYISL